MNFILPDYLADYSKFRHSVILPVKKSFEERKKIFAHPSTDNPSTTPFPNITSINFTAIGLDILRDQHKKVNRMRIVIFNCKLYSLNSNLIVFYFLFSFLCSIMMSLCSDRCFLLFYGGRKKLSLLIYPRKQSLT